MAGNLNYGIIGNCRSAALVSEHGSIDWCCLPDPDSDSIFASLLDANIGGKFGIIPDKTYSISQKYDGDTNVLITSYENDNTGFEIIDFMPRYKTESGTYFNPPEIYRLIRIIKGQPVIRIDYDPKPNFASSTVKHIINSDYIKSLTSSGKYESLYLYSDLDKQKIIEHQWIHLSADAFLLLSYNQKLIEVNIDHAYLEYHRTFVYWLNWSARTRKFKKYQKEIVRSALVLKLLTYQKSGAILAAITTSLPESLDEKRNWDYRYCWIRDSSMIIKALLDIGHSVSAQRFLNFILNVNEGKHEDIQIMYGIRGEKKLKEKILKHLKGYKNVGPVRTGNSAYIQKQNDIYGILINAIYLSLTKFPSTLDTTEELWTFVRGMVEMVKFSWKEPDRGIWEIRKENRHFVFSKVLSWVAIDRGCKIARMIGKDSFAEEWSFLREEIHNDILTHGWNKQLKSFTQTYDGNYLDASLLLIEEYGFIEASDPMFISTVLNIRDNLTVNGMMFRYKNEDDFGRPKSSLIVCTFWLIDALFKIGLKEDAEALFIDIINSSNHLGLFSEHIDVETRELLGNFPQGYSHLGLIKAALTINDVISHPEEDHFTFIKP